MVVGQKSHVIKEIFGHELRLLVSEGRMRHTPGQLRAIATNFWHRQQFLFKTSKHECCYNTNLYAPKERIAWHYAKVYKYGRGSKRLQSENVY